MKHVSNTLNSTYSTDDLRDLAQRAGPFLTIVLPSPSSLDDAAHRLDVRWKNARRAAEQGGWPSQRLEELDEAIARIEHDDAAAFVMVQSTDGQLIEEALMSEVTATSVSVDASPRLLTILDSRQRTLPHIVVVTDRVGADIVTFDAGVVTAEHGIEGERLHIHRGHPGGWSQRRFQQRAENTWEDNADSVVDAVFDAAHRAKPVLIAVAGDVRSKALVEAGLRERTQAAVVLLESGNPDGLAEEVVRMVDDQHARGLRQAIRRLRDAAGHDAARSGHSVLEALSEGRVDTLLVHDITDHDRGSIAPGEGTVERPADRLVDRAVTHGLGTAASVVVVPNLPELSDGVAATLRW